MKIEITTEPNKDRSEVYKAYADKIKELQEKKAKEMAEEQGDKE